MKKKILITGANGFIGSNLTTAFTAKDYLVLGLDNKRNESAEYKVEQCDVTNMKALNQTLDGFRPEIIIHCAAIKNLPECEENKEKSLINNVLSTEYLTNYAQKTKAKLIYISSDVVFDGERGNYSEDDIVNPINWYGKTKVFSETIVKSLPNSAICRTALVIGRLPVNYKKILKSEIENEVLVNQTVLPQYIYHRLKGGKKVTLPSIIISNPTPVDLLCAFITRIAAEDANGIFHTAGPDSISRFEVGELIGKIFGCNINQVNENNDNISGLRPRNISLDTKRTFYLLHINPDEWRLKDYLSQCDLYE